MVRSPNWIWFSVLCTITVNLDTTNMIRAYRRPNHPVGAHSLDSCQGEDGRLFYDYSTYPEWPCGLPGFHPLMIKVGPFIRWVCCNKSRELRNWWVGGVSFRASISITALPPTFDVSGKIRSTLGLFVQIVLFFSLLLFMFFIVRKVDNNSNNIFLYRSQCFNVTVYQLNLALCLF